MDNFIFPPPSAAGIRDHFLTIKNSGINTVKIKINRLQK